MRAVIKRKLENARLGIKPERKKRGTFVAERSICTGSMSRSMSLYWEKWRQAKDQGQIVPAAPKHHPDKPMLNTHVPEGQRRILYDRKDIFVMRNGFLVKETKKVRVDIAAQEPEV